MIRALFFDFDGLMIDTETVEYRVWADIYRSHGQELDIRLWLKCVGRHENFWDPVAHLDELCEGGLDREEIKHSVRQRAYSEMDILPLMPGVRELITEAVGAGLYLAIVSSSSHDWLDRHLPRLKLDDTFDQVLCGDDVSEAKPAPELYLKALQRSGVDPLSALALEDSPNGIRSAKAAGLRCVAVPNSVTKHEDLSGADLVLESLSGISLKRLKTLLPS